LTLSLPNDNDGYSKNVLCTLNQISTFLNYAWGRRTVILFNSFSYKFFWEYVATSLKSYVRYATLHLTALDLTFCPHQFLAHLAFRPCELLSSLFVRRPSVNIGHVSVVSNKKIFKISINQNTLWALAAMLDFRSAPKTKILYMTIQWTFLPSLVQILAEILKIFLSETTKSIELWLCRNDHWVVLY
jgi:hypothetical protein